MLFLSGSSSIRCVQVKSGKIDASDKQVRVGVRMFRRNSKSAFCDGQIFVGAVGLVAAGATGNVIMQQVQKKQTESMRTLLSSKSGLNIDASILDEVTCIPNTHGAL